MNQQTVTIIKIKKGKEKILRDWFIQLETTRKNEALKSIKKENVSQEWGTIVKIASSYYWIGYSQRSGKKKKADMRMKVNREHRKITKQCIEKINHYPLLYSCK